MFASDKRRIAIRCCSLVKPRGTPHYPGQRFTWRATAYCRTAPSAAAATLSRRTIRQQSWRAQSENSAAASLPGLRMFEHFSDSFFHLRADMCSDIHPGLGCVHVKCRSCGCASDCIRMPRYVLRHGCKSAWVASTDLWRTIPAPMCNRDRAVCPWHAWLRRFGF